MRGREFNHLDTPPSLLAFSLALLFRNEKAQRHTLRLSVLPLRSIRQSTTLQKFLRPSAPACAATPTLWISRLDILPSLYASQILLCRSAIQL